MISRSLLFIGILKMSYEIEKAQKPPGIKQKITKFRIKVNKYFFALYRCRNKCYF